MGRPAISALVIGKEVIGTIRRRARAGEYRSNVHQGASTEKIDLTKKREKEILRVASCTGLKMTGVDWIEAEAGPVFLEVNATPGFKGFESATGIDVAGAMVKYAWDSGTNSKSE
jgi:ribosomal protein S6--L-glutamate ligase